MSATGLLLTESDLASRRKGTEMIEFLKAFFKPDPGKKLLKERDQLYKRAVELQRNGDLRSYGKVMARIQELEIEYASLPEENE